MIGSTNQVHRVEAAHGAAHFTTPCGCRAINLGFRVDDNDRPAPGVSVDGGKIGNDETARLTGARRRHRQDIPLHSYADWTSGYGIEAKLNSALHFPALIRLRPACGPVNPQWIATRT